MPLWPDYRQEQVNYVFDATDYDTDDHCELDNYRAEGIGIWNTHALQAYYGEDTPHDGEVV